MIGEFTELLVYCGVDELRAKRGDILVVVNGVLVGSRRQTLPSLPAPVTLVTPARSNGGHPFRYTQERQEILNYVRAHAPLKAAALLDGLKLNTKNPKRKVYQNILNNMYKYGHLDRHEEDKGKRGHARYILGKGISK